MQAKYHINIAKMIPQNNTNKKPRLAIAIHVLLVGLGLESTYLVLGITITISILQEEKSVNQNSLSTELQCKVSVLKIQLLCPCCRSTSYSLCKGGGEETKHIITFQTLNNEEIKFQNMCYVSSPPWLVHAFFA